MYKFDSTPKPTEHTIWRVVDAHWQNIQREYISGKDCQALPLYSGTLADYLWILCVDIPDYYRYALIETATHSIKFRQYGGSIIIYAQPLY